MGYNGTIELIAGVKPANNGNFPMVNAKDVYVDDDTRLDAKLNGLDDSIDDLNAAVVTDSTLSQTGKPADAKAVGDAINNITIEVDATLSQSGKAADAKATGDAVSDLKTQLNDISEETSVELTGTKTTGKFINGDAIVDTGAAAFYVVEYSVEFGDNLRINGAAANNGYLYIFTNNNGETISYPTKNTSGTLKNYTDVEIIAPENAVHLVISSHSSSSYTQAKAEKITGYRVIGLDELEDEVDDLREQEDNVFNEIYIFTELSVVSTGAGYKLKPNKDGLCVSDANYKLVKFSIVAGEQYRVVSPDLFQFQNAVSVPTSGNSNRVGKTYNAGTLIVKAPEGATYLIISTPNDGTYSVEHTINRIDEIEDEVDNAETNIAINESKTKALKTGVEPLFEYSYSEATGEIIDTFSEITGVNIENAESAVIRSAQIFEAVLPTTTQSGITFTKNNDGTYTINGSHTSSLAFNLNQSTRTGTDKLITLQGNYSIRVTVLSGDCDTSGAAYGNIYGLFLFRLANETNALSVSLTGNDTIKEKAVVSNSINAALAVSTVANVVYNNLRIKISVNKGDKLLDTDCDYVAPVTITNMNDALMAAQNCTPCVWIAASPNTAKITVFGKKVKEVEIPDPPEPQEPVNWYGVIEKYNDCVDTLMQMFTKPLFLVYTDIHASLDNLERINTWANANKSSIYVSDTYCLGDMLHDHPGDDRPIANFDNVAIWPKTLKVIGNHDVGTGSSELTAKQTYDAYIAPYISQWGNVVQPTDAATDGKSYYYKDYNNKIRIIVLDIYHYDSAQSTWFETVLADAITNSLAVIIAQHADICTAAEKEPLNPDYPFARKHNGYTGLQYSLSYTSQRATVDTFIENGGTFICWLTGHMHADMAGTYTGTHGKQLSIVLANAGMSIDGTYLRFNNYSQDCFTYLGVDTDTNYLYLLRIGESVDKWFHKNLFLCYDYANHAVIEYQ